MSTALYIKSMNSLMGKYDLLLFTFSPDCNKTKEYLIFLIFMSRHYYPCILPSYTHSIRHGALLFLV